jgi:hypothetical protein
MVSEAQSPAGYASDRHEDDQIVWKNQSRFHEHISEIFCILLSACLRARGYDE